ncbi:MAG: PAS domain S-box protein [Bacteroidales bacterium]|nr:PAS domain S-box protein [Bacteroidales bacterium]
MNKENLQENKKGIINFMKKLSLKDTSIRTKFTVIFVITLLLSLLIMAVVVLFATKKSVKDEAYQQLELRLTYEKNNIEDFFSVRQNLARLISSDNRIGEACRDFSEAFVSIENDNFYTAEATNTEVMSEGLLNYYETEVFPTLKSDAAYLQTILFPKSNRSVILQYLYLAANSRPVTEKYLVNKAPDGSSYSQYHSNWHSFFRNLMQEYNLDDILLADKKGNIVYSVYKETDFAANLNNDIFKNTGLSAAYKMSNNADKGFIYTSDLSFYIPSGGQPVLFISTPVYMNSSYQGVLIFKVKSTTIDNIIKGKASEDKTSIASLNNVYLLGKDRYLRSNSSDINFKKKELSKKIDKSIYTKTELIKEYNSAALLIQGSKEFTSLCFSGLEGNGKYRNYFGDKMMERHSTLSISGLDWAIVSEISISDAYKASNIGLIIVFSIIIILILAAFAGSRAAKLISDKLKQIVWAMNTLKKGETFNDIRTHSNDELGKILTSTNDLKNWIDFISEGAIKMAEGDFSVDFDISSEKDKLGLALIKLRQSLLEAQKEEKKRLEEDKIRNWMNDGLAKFNDLLRMEFHNLEDLAYKVTKSLIDYLDASVGGLFLVRDNEGEKTYLELISSYAYDRKKYLKKRIEVGEGLIGNCYLEKKTTYLKRIPEDYIEVSSGFGGSKPTSMAIVPMKLEDQIFGVIELASLNEFTSYQIELIERVAEMTSSTINVVKLNVQTKELLEISKQRNEELAAQEEEMRQNMEEMAATQEEMQRIKKEEEEREKEKREYEQKMMKKLQEQNEKLLEDERKLEIQTLELKKKEAQLREKIGEMEQTQNSLNEEKALMDALMDNVPEHIYFKDKQSRFIRFSRSMLKLFGLTRDEELLGKSDFDFFSEEHAKPAFDSEMKIIKTDKPIIDLIEKEVHKDGSVSWVTTTKMPLKDKEGTIFGTFGISKDITHTKLLEEEASKKTGLLLELQKQLKELEIKYEKLTQEKSQLQKEFENLKKRSGGR